MFECSNKWALFKLHCCQQHWTPRVHQWLKSYWPTVLLHKGVKITNLGCSLFGAVLFSFILGFCTKPKADQIYYFYQWQLNPNIGRFVCTLQTSSEGSIKTSVLIMLLAILILNDEAPRLSLICSRCIHIVEDSPIVDDIDKPSRNTNKNQGNKIDLQ